MGTLVRHQKHLLDSFLNADRIFDFLLSIGMRPFVELSFMPQALASGGKTVFKYRGNVTPPHDYRQWAAFIKRLVGHWVDRYGVREVGRWFFEVWNEPNLKAFWTGSREEYFTLYRYTVEAIKSVDGSLRVGGPSTARDACRVDWHWAQNGGAKVSHGWTPERGFLPYWWAGYCEGLLLCVLGLGSPTYPLPPETYDAYTSTYRWTKLYGHEFLYGGPLFLHQLPHLWVDFRGIQDAFMRAKCIDYFENSRRATYVQQAYAIRNPKRFAGYGEYAWGITASNGPGPVTRRVNGVTRRFLGYRARGVPWGPDDGTLAPWAVAASLPFAPEIVLPTLRHAQPSEQIARVEITKNSSPQRPQRP